MSSQFFSQIDLSAATQSNGLKTPDQDNQLLTIFLISTSILSIIGSLFNLTTTLILRIAHNTLGKMVVILCLMDLLYNTSFLLTNYIPGDTLVCAIESSFMIGGFAGSIFWTGCFAHCLYISAKSDNIVILEDYLKRYAFLSIVFAIIVGSTSVATRFIQYDEIVGCKHQTKINSFDISFCLVLIVPVMLAVIYCTFCYISTIQSLRKLRDKLHLELMVYPLVLIICYFPYIGVGIFKQIDEEATIPFLLNLISSSVFNLQGFFNAFAYGLSRRIIDGYKKLCCFANDQNDDLLPHTFNSSNVTIVSSRAHTQLSDPRYLKISESV